uniref:Catalase n=1 Tax=Anisakis simplex TaxID=6269 RepID=A0A0M3KG53_ANISI
LFCGLQANEPTVPSATGTDVWTNYVENGRANEPTVPSATGTDVWTNYVENGRVRFDRLHSVNAVLAFERNAAGAAEPMQLPLISKKELFEKLKQKNEQRNQIELDKQKLPENQQIGHFGQALSHNGTIVEDGHIS